MLGITPQTERSATATEFINQFVLMRSCRLAVVDEGLLYRNFGPVRCASRVLSLLAAIDHVAKSAEFRLEGGVRVCGDAVLRYFWCGFAVIFILTRGIAVSKH